MKNTQLLRVSILGLLLCPVFAFSQWRSLPIRSQTEAAANMTGGEGEQLFHGLTRSISNPDFIYACQDVMGTWKSTDGGNTWQKNIDRGLWLPFTTSIEVDPVNPNLLLLQSNRSWWNQNAITSVKLAGLYRSIDGGSTWEQVLNVDNPLFERRMRHLVTYSKATMTNNSTSPTRWFTAFDKIGLYRSDNGGLAGSWVKVASFDSVAVDVVAHPTSPDTVYVSTYAGLLRSTNGGQDLSPWKFIGDRVTSVLVHADIPNKMYVVVSNKYGATAIARNGMYVSTDYGATFTRPVIKNLTKNITVSGCMAYMNPGFPEQIFWISDASYGKITEISNDGGNTWSLSIPYATTFPGMGRETGWRRSITGAYASILPNAKDKTQDAVATGSATFLKITGVTTSNPSAYESATGFTGNSATHWSDAINFHPSNSNLFILSCNDIGPRTTTTNGAWFYEPDPIISTWKNQGRTLWTGSYSADYQPLNGSQVVVASFGYYLGKAHLMRSDDNGVTWDSLLTTYPKRDANTDTIMLNSTNGNVIWDQTYRNDYEFIGFDSQLPAYCYSSDMRSTDGGLSFQRIPFPTSYLEGGVWPSVFGISTETNGNTHLIAVGAYKNRAFRSDDHGDTWYEIYSRLQSGGSMKMLDRILPFAVHPTNPNIFFTIDANHDLREVIWNPSTHSSTYSSLHVFNAIPTGIPADVISANQIRFIAIDPINPDVMYVSMSVSGIPNVYRSTNGGTTWLSISDSLTCHEGAMKVNPYTRELYRGSMAGTWIYPAPVILSTDLNKSISQLRFFVTNHILNIVNTIDNESFSICDLTGKNVLKFKTSTISVENCPTGIYILRSNYHSPVKLFLK